MTLTYPVKCTVTLFVKAVQMMSFVAFLLIIIISYGVLMQSIWFPYNDFDWALVREIFIKPYFNVYGEVYASDVWREFSFVL